MGTSFEFTCECGYNCQASGGEDMGFIARVRTMVCQECTEVVDVLIGTSPKGMPYPDEDFKKSIGRCSHCGGTHLTPWPETFPCPKCQKNMKQGLSVIMWD